MVNFRKFPIYTESYSPIHISNVLLIKRFVHRKWQFSDLTYAEETCSVETIFAIFQNLYSMKIIKPENQN